MYAHRDPVASPWAPAAVIPVIPSDSPALAAAPAAAIDDDVDDEATEDEEAEDDAEDGGAAAGTPAGGIGSRRPRGNASSYFAVCPEVSLQHPPLRAAAAAARAAQAAPPAALEAEAAPEADQENQPPPQQQQQVEGQQQQQQPAPPQQQPPPPRQVEDMPITTYDLRGPGRQPAYWDHLQFVVSQHCISARQPAGVDAPPKVLGGCFPFNRSKAVSAHAGVGGGARRLSAVERCKSDFFCFQQLSSIALQAQLVTRASLPALHLLHLPFAPRRSPRTAPLVFART